MTKNQDPQFDAELDAMRDQQITAENDDFDNDLADDAYEADESSRMAPTEAEAAADAMQSAAVQIEQLTEEVAALKDRLLREMAEMENLRRRSIKEKSDASKYSVSNFARDMIGVGDNLNRALQALPQEVRDQAADEVKNLFVGVEMTNSEMLTVFDRHGIKLVDPKGEKFDPNFHQAMFEVPNPDVAAGTVVEVVQVGYAIGERVLRPALVGVAKGGPKFSLIADDDENATGDLGGKIDTSA